MGRGDAKAEDVGQFGVDWVAVLGVAVGLLGAAGDGFDAAADKAHDLARRAVPRLGDLEFGAGG